MTDCKKSAEILEIGHHYAPGIRSKYDCSLSQLDNHSKKYDIRIWVPFDNPDAIKRSRIWRKGLDPFVILIVQPPGSGKTTLLRLIDNQLIKQGWETVRLSPDVFYTALEKVPTSSICGKKYKYNRNDAMGKLFYDEVKRHYHLGYVVIIDACNTSSSMFKYLIKNGMRYYAFSFIGAKTVKSLDQPVRYRTDKKSAIKDPKNEYPSMIKKMPSYGVTFFLGRKIIDDRAIKSDRKSSTADSKERKSESKDEILEIIDPDYVKWAINNATHRIKSDNLNETTLSNLEDVEATVKSKVKGCFKVVKMSSLHIHHYPTMWKGDINNMVDKVITHLPTFPILNKKIMGSFRFYAFIINDDKESKHARISIPLTIDIESAQILETLIGRDLYFQGNEIIHRKSKRIACKLTNSFSYTGHGTILISY